MRLKYLFTVPEGQRVTEKQLLRVLISSICSILLCMGCLASATWAWFTVGIENTGNVIQIASVTSGVTVKKGEDVVSPSDEGRFNLEANAEYSVTVSAATDSSAEDSNLYAIFSIDGMPVGCTTLTSSGTADGKKTYQAEITIKAEKQCTFSWVVSWLKPNNLGAVTDNTISIPAAETSSVNDDSTETTEAKENETTPTETTATATTEPASTQE